ncbi:MAG: ATPase domain-containing protein [Candidatus Nezhaarchaeales archaeon]
MMELLDVKGLRDLWSRVFRIATGCRALDRLLGGGFPSSHVTIVYGERSSGKTQLCHQLIAHHLTMNPQLFAVYVDVDLSFSPQRVASIVSRYGVTDPKNILSRILYYKPTTFEEQVHVVDLLDETYDKVPHSLIIVDSISTLARGEYGVAVVEMNRALSSYIRKLQDYAFKRNVVIVATDNVRLIKHQNRELLVPVSSQAIEISTTHLRLIRGPGAKRICRVEASPLISEGEALFLIGGQGLVDCL